MCRSRMGRSSTIGYFMLPTVTDEAISTLMLASLSTSFRSKRTSLFAVPNAHPPMCMNSAQRCAGTPWLRKCCTASSSA
jgi:hypothetical protein